MGAGRAGGREGRRSDKGTVLRRHGDILAGNGEEVARRGSRFVERHIRRSPLLEGNFLIIPTFLDGGRDVHLVTRKEISAAIFVLDAGAGELAVLGRHLAGRAEAVGGVAVGCIHIDCMVCVAEGRSSGEGTAGVAGTVAFFFPLDLHIANLGQGRSSHRINTVAVSIILILTGVYHVDLNRAVGVDGHIFICKQTVAVTTACRIARRSAGDVHRSVFGDGDVFLRVNAVGFLVGARAIVRHVDNHFSIARDRHIAGFIAGRPTSLDADCGIVVAYCFGNRERAAAFRSNGYIAAHITADRAGDGVVTKQFNGDVRCGGSACYDAPAVVILQRQDAGIRIIRGVVICCGAGEVVRWIVVFIIQFPRPAKILAAVN